MVEREIVLLGIAAQALVDLQQRVRIAKAGVEREQAALETLASVSGSDAAEAMFKPSHTYRAKGSEGGVWHYGDPLKLLMQSPERITSVDTLVFAQREWERYRSAVRVALRNLAIERGAEPASVASVAQDVLHDGGS